jgi:hypothetical protein
MAKTDVEKERTPLQCSFCGKTQREVRKLIAGPTVYICDECISLCNDIIAEESESATPPPRTEADMDFLVSSAARVSDQAAALRRAWTPTSDEGTTWDAALNLALDRLADALFNARIMWTPRKR